MTMKPEQTRREQQPLSLLHAALSYAQNGWAVFPLHGKFPYKDFHWRTDATTDPERIAAWWTTHPRANIGLPTGTMSGVIVIDIDPRNAEKANPNPLRVLEERFGTLPVTRTSRTAQGGLHKYFQHPQDGKTYANRVQLAGIAGVDFRGDGGYVVLPPSILYNRLSYKWAGLSVTFGEHSLVVVE